MFEPALQAFGLWKFLTYHSLLFQMASCVLHLASCVAPKYIMLRDIIFTSFAFPIGNLVVLTFWTVWWTQGREMIYPVSIENYYPPWLNHVTHTIILPLNIAQTYITCHRYLRKGSLVSCCYIGIYCIYSLYIRYVAGIFVYPFMNQMSAASVAIYMMSCLFCTVVLYEIGFFLTAILHLKKLRRFTE